MASNNDGFGFHRAGGGQSSGPPNATQSDRNQPDVPRDDDEEGAEDVPEPDPNASRYLTGSPFGTRSPQSRSPYSRQMMTPLGTGGSAQQGAAGSGGAQALFSSAGPLGGNVLGSGSTLGSVPIHQQLPPRVNSPRKDTPSPAADYRQKFATAHYSGATARIGEIDHDDDANPDPLAALQKQFREMRAICDTKSTDHDKYLQDLASEKKQQKLAVSQLKDKAQLEAKVGELQARIEELTVAEQPDQGDLRAVNAQLEQQVQTLTSRAESAEEALAAKPDFSRTQWEGEIKPAVEKVGNGFTKARTSWKECVVENQQLKEENARLKARLEGNSS